MKGKVITMMKFEKTASMTIIGRENYTDECGKLTFNNWEKGGKRRIYINDYKRRTIGFIDRDTKEYTQYDNQGLNKAEINGTIEAFRAMYEF